MTLAGCGKNWVSRESERRRHRSLSSQFLPFAPKRKSVELSFRRFENSQNVEVFLKAVTCRSYKQKSKIYVGLQASTNTVHDHRSLSFILMPLSFPYFPPHVSRLKIVLVDSRQIAKLPPILAGLDPVARLAGRNPRAVRIILEMPTSEDQAHENIDRLLRSLSVG
jgi:hypothetical protein